MSFCIETHIDALVASLDSGRIEGVSLPLDSEGKPHFVVNHNHITFEVDYHATEYLLTIPFGSHDNTLQRAEQLLRQCGHLPFLENKRLIYNLLTLPTSGSGTHSLNAILEPRHSSLDTFIKLNHAPSQRQLLRNAIESIAQTLAAISHNNLNLDKVGYDYIRFDPLGGVHLMVYPLEDKQHSCNIYLTLAAVATMLYVAASQIDAYKLLHEPIYETEEFHHRLRVITATAEHYGIGSIVELIRCCRLAPAPSAIIGAITALTAEPFRPLPLLTALLKDHNSSNTIEFVPPASQPQHLVHVDIRTFEHISPPSEMICRGYKDGYWHYINHDGTRLPLEPLVGAFDFYEGRAVVRTVRGYGVIDRRGRWVMRDVWDDIVWHGSENIITAASDNIWHIYNRSGRQLSTVGAEWMGDASEGFISARRGGRYAYYSTDGAMRTDFVYDEVHSFNNGYAMVVRRGERYYIDTSFHKLSARQQEEMMAKR